MDRSNGSFTQHLDKETTMERSVNRRSKPGPQLRPQQFFTPAEAAKALGVTQRKLRQWAFLGLVSVHDGPHGKKSVFLPVGVTTFPGCRVPMSARRMVSGGAQ